MARQSQGRKAPAPREATYLESDEEIHRALKDRRAVPPGHPPTVIPDASADLDEQTRPDRPRERPPMALVCILDDGSAEGEWRRLRNDRYVLGRSEGDILIPHDVMMSGRHAELQRRATSAGPRWVLVDLQSTNGTFVRVARTVLTDHTEVLIGAGRYRFEEPGDSPTPGPEGPANQPPRGATVGWQGESAPAAGVSLVELTPAGSARRIGLNQAENWIGRDPRCQVVRGDDLLVNARHARIYRDAKGQWLIENNKSLNGVWLRIDQPMPLAGNCYFRLGEQRFLFRPL